MLLKDIRNTFPQLATTVYGRPLVYLDNAATIQRPQSVIDKWVEMTEKSNSNLHRAVHHIAAVATEEYESTRECVRQFLNAKDSKEIIFTSGTTNSINLLAYSFGEAFVSEGDEIIVSECEHHSDIVPWQMMCQRRDAVLRVLPIDDDGRLRLDLLESMLTDRTKLCCVAHISNVLGLINPIKQIVSICHSKGCRVLADGAQGVVHCQVDVQDLGVDFYAFSGHKMYAAPGTGVLYGRRELLEQMPPYMGGGEMIGTVKWTGTTYAPLPQKFEAGTQNLAGTPTFKPAIDTVKLLRDNDIEAQYQAICDYVYNSLQQIDGLKLYGVPRGTIAKIGLYSLSVEGAHHEDLALLLDKMGVAVRSGQMCAEPLMDRFGVTGMLRASFAPYNTMEEAEYFIKSLKKAIAMLR